MMMTAVHAVFAVIMMMESSGAGDERSDDDDDEMGRHLAPLAVELGYETCAF